MKIKRFMIVVLILAAFQVLTDVVLCRGAGGQAAGQVGEGPSRLMNPAQYRQFLASLKTDLARWQAQLEENDVGALGLDFKTGKIIEDDLSHAKLGVVQCQEFEAGLEKRQTLGDSVRLYSCMESMGEELDALHEDLTWIGGNSPQARRWTSELDIPHKEISEDTVKLLGHVLSIADIANDSCPQLRQYLH